jgi:AAA domain
MNSLNPLPSNDFEYACSDEVRSRAQHGDSARWLWHGFLAAGQVTLLTGQWKAGKTTLLSVLLARMGTGGSLAGLAVRPGKAVVVSEEGDDLWAERIAALGIGPHMHLLSRPFRGRPTREQWHNLIESLVRRHHEHGLDLVVIDPLAAFLSGRAENDASTMLDVLLPLQELTLLGIAVLILHHPRKAPSAPGQTARGTGALPGSVDILMELDAMNWATEDDRRRRLYAFSRHVTTPRRLVIELTPDGNDYISHGDFVGHDFRDNWQILHGVLEDADQKLTRKAILAAWPSDYAKPADQTLWRWLNRAVKEGLLLCCGAGRCKDPFVYWLDGMEEVWDSNPYKLDPLPSRYAFDDEFKRKTLAEVLAEREKKTRRGQGGI